MIIKSKIALFFILLTLSTVSLLANDQQDSIRQIFTQIPDSEKLAAWETWYKTMDSSNPVNWEEALPQACSDAKKLLDEDTHKDWCLNLKIQFSENLLFHGFRKKATEILDTASELIGDQTTRQAKWNIAKAASQYFQYEEQDSAIIYFQKAESLSNTLNDPEINFALWTEWGRMLLRVPDQKLAENYLKKAGTFIPELSLNIEEQSKYKLLLARATKDNKKFNEAQKLFTELLNNAAQLDSFTNTQIKSAYGSFLYYADSQQKGLNYLENLKTEVRSRNSQTVWHIYNKAYIDCLQDSGNYAKIDSVYLDDVKAFFFNVTKERGYTLKTWEDKLETTKKKAQITELLKAEEIKKSNFQTTLASIIALILAGSALLFFYLYRNRNKQKQLVLEIERDQQISENRDRLFSSITHDIRTPLALMMAPLERSERKIKNPQAIEDLQLAQRSGKRLMELFNQILDWNKAEAQAMTLNPQAGTLGFALHTLCRRFSDQAKEKGVQFDAEINLPEGQYVLDYDKIDKILSNLVGNAIKFCNKGEQVNLHASWIDNKLSLIVNDNGPGISEEDQVRLFDRHYQGEQGKIKGGTGIGLALVKELIEMMKGNIDLKSQLGSGTTFTINAPVERIDEEKSEAAIFEPDTKPNVFTGNNKPMILLVEDEPDLLKFLESALKKEYEVKIAESTTIGLSIAQSQIPDMIVSDWSLPDHDGGWLCRNLKDNELTAHIPVMILTAFSSDENLKEVFDSGAVARMNKPFQLETLHRQVKNILEQQRRMQNSWSGGQIEDGEEQPVASKDPFISKVFEVIDANLDDEDFTVEKMASELLLSRVQLFRKVKNTTSFSPSQLLSIRRLEAGQRLLKTTDQSIADIAFAVGFSDPNYFSTAYKKHFDISPSQERV